ncbi:MAG: hypothetical protein GY790_21890 [Bacteroidetes bacterium]|nr:hypothetical protein [Bacteroidota bacterium]
MIDLEKHIKEKRLQLDADSPAEGHEERFRQMLEGRPVRRVTFRHVLQVAASIAIILASSVVLIRTNRSGDKIAEQKVPASVIEADQYYSTQVGYRVDQIKQLDFNDAEDKMVLLDELEELDSYQQQLMKDLEANPNDERVINALIKHYQVKLDVMDQIIYQLNQFKTETSNNHEKESV